MKFVTCVGRSRIYLPARYEMLFPNQQLRTFRWGEKLKANMSEILNIVKVDVQIIKFRLKI